MTDGTGAGATTELGAGELRRRLGAGELTATGVAEAFLARIEALDPRLNCFVRLDPAVERQAAEADRRLARGDDRALTGVPVAIKDNILTRGLETDCGSRVLAGFVPPRDATVVARLRAAGAIVLGKTNLDEFGMGSSTEYSVHGATRNPWDTTRVAGGSSGGSAAAVAADLAPVALGSDTGGSIRQPAAFCGVVGLKPTYGRVSRSGLVAFGSSLDQVGPLCRSVEDAATVLETIAGADPSDATSARQPAEDWVAECGRGVAGVRVGLPREYYGEGLDPEIRAALEAAAASLARAGATIEEISLEHTRFAVPTYYLVATAEASSNLERFDGVRYGARADDGDGLRAMYRRSRAAFGQEVRRRIMLGTFALSAGYHDRFYGTAQRVRRRLRRDFESAFDHVDVLLTPTSPTPAFRLEEKLDDPLAMYLSDVFTVTANLAGVPALAVPLGCTRDGLPVGGQLIAAPFAEARLFRAGGVLERDFPAGRPKLEMDGRAG